MIKSGSTVRQRFRTEMSPDIIESAVITYSTRDKKEVILTKRYPEDAVWDGEYIILPLSQAETELLCGMAGAAALVELQFNLVSGSVVKSSICEVYLEATLATEFVDGSHAADGDSESGIVTIEASEIIFGGVGESGLGIYVVSSECSGSSVMIFKSDITVPDGRELFRGDLLLISSSGMLYTVTEVENTSVTAVYVCSLKGEKGNPGPSGEKGEAGYTPQRGVDYWTEADIAMINESFAAQLSSLDSRISTLEGSMPEEYDGSVTVG